MGQFVELHANGLSGSNTGARLQMRVKRSVRVRSGRDQSLDFFLEPLSRDTIYSKMSLKGYSGISLIENRKFGGEKVKETLTAVKGPRDSERMEGRRQEELEVTLNVMGDKVSNDWGI